MILTATVCVVVLVRTRRTGSQALAAICAQQRQVGATGLAVPPAGTGGTGWLAGWGRRGKEGEREGGGSCQSLQKLIFSSYVSFPDGYRTASHSCEPSKATLTFIPKVYFSLNVAHILSTYQHKGDKQNMNKLIAVKYSQQKILHLHNQKRWQNILLFKTKLYLVYLYLCIWPKVLLETKHK